MRREEKSLQGKRALVTGAARRIGHSIALALAREGVSVVVHFGSSEPEAKKTVEEIEALGCSAWAVQKDLNDPEGVHALGQQAQTLTGKIDILVNSASIYPEDRLANLSLPDFKKTMQVNFLAPLQLSKDLFGGQAEGIIVNLLDARPPEQDLTHASYALSKNLLTTLTRMMAVDFAPGVRTNGVALGPILAPNGADENFLARMSANLPLKRHGDLDEVTAAVLFLTKNQYLTGQVLYVDGGRHLRGGDHA